MYMSSMLSNLSPCSSQMECKATRGWYQKRACLRGEAGLRAAGKSCYTCSMKTSSMQVSQPLPDTRWMTIYIHIYIYLYVMKNLTIFS